MRDEHVPPDDPRYGLAALRLATHELRGGRPEAAMERLIVALDAGCHYPRELLSSADLAPLHTHSSFAAFSERSASLHAAALASARPRLTFAMPDTLPDAFGYPLLVVLHGNNSNARATAPRWAAMADKGWVVAIPQSSAVGFGPDSYVWNDRERTASELDAHLAKIKAATQIDTGRIVLAGFSMGATQAIALALTKRVTVRGVVPVCAWLPSIDEFAGLVEGGAAKMLRAYVIVGAEDPSRDGAVALVDVMKRHNIRAEVDVRDGMGHEYPPDMERTLETALAFATK
jgi:predicted esterase